MEMCIICGKLPFMTDGNTPRLDALLQRVRTACEAKGHGAMSDLAKLLGRKTSQVSEYLSTGERKLKRRPNAEMALAMIEWLNKKS